MNIYQLSITDVTNMYNIYRSSLSLSLSPDIPNSKIVFGLSIIVIIGWGIILDIIWIIVKIVGGK